MTNIKPYSELIIKSLTPWRNPVNSKINLGGVTNISLACFSNSKNSFNGSEATTSGRFAKFWFIIAIILKWIHPILIFFYLNLLASLRLRMWYNSFLVRKAITLQTILLTFCISLRIGKILKINYQYTFFPIPKSLQFYFLFQLNNRLPHHWDHFCMILYLPYDNK